ncbi:MAG: hypothetical protein K2P93_03810 [Alphaproteobacteria bacterium]|nr:hypothetical protein [Alphaproteobacteria bacterium]
MNNQQDLPLKKDIAARFVPKVVALMVYLGTLCFVFTLFMIHSTKLWEGQLSTQLTLEIPTTHGHPSADLQSRVLHLLNRTPGIQSATAVPQKEIASLLHSLLGEKVDETLLSLPIIIDISLNNNEIVDIPSLETHLKNISSDIQLTDHRSWQAHVSDVIHMSVLIALVVTALVLFVALATTTFATRTSLLIHRQVIEVLSLIGATPSYIAKQFQMNALKQGLFSSTIGSLFAFLTFMGVGVLLEKIGLPFSIDSTFFSQALCVFVLAPFLTALLMMLSARFAVLITLRS